MPPSYFPLRWESTGDQWWYASPIDWAAANGLYDLVRELLHLDTNLLIKLTSLRRIRRLETVWDDEAQFDDVARCRSQVARKLLLECETKTGHNSLIRAGYGGWLLYTAASAGDVGFVKELLERDPHLVFGEGEYGVTDVFYAAARSKNSEVFRLLLDLALSPGSCHSNGGELEEQLVNVSPEFKWEMMNRAVHAAARGGNLEILRLLLADCSDVLVYKDAQESTILHTASGRGQVEVVKYVVASFDIISFTDNQGNTALHVAAYRGYLAVVEVLILASPSLASLTNSYGDTFLHMAVAGFRTPGFQRLDRLIELMTELVCGNIVNMQDIINVRNNDGRTALHMAVIENIQCNLVELLMTVPSIGLNICDADGMTPLDILKQWPRSASSEILIKQLISAGGDLQLIPDAEIFLYTGIENASDASYDQASMDLSACSGELSQCDSTNSLDNKRAGSVSGAARRLKSLLQWPRRKEKKASKTVLGDDTSLESFSMCRNLEDSLIPLRQKYSNLSSFPNNKRTFSLRSDLPSPSTKKKFTVGLMQGVIKAMPRLAGPARSPSSLSGSSVSSSNSMDKQKGVDIAGTSYSTPSFNGKPPQMNHKQNSFNKKLMNRYLSFGAHGLSANDSVTYAQPNQSFKRLSSLVA
ncbi:hypothetical protein FH972_009310 [Carpinus fangiana]|uniref:Uncharacterized protein n=1 Tax=Carpinus fangiana TaxID=176857 RepID=A0A5N6R4F6_9ROSI|nr:hypothetical protein FH972_009310 [Carpinus fangiana]